MKIQTGIGNTALGHSPISNAVCLIPVKSDCVLLLVYVAYPYTLHHEISSRLYDTSDCHPFAFFIQLT